MIKILHIEINDKCENCPLVYFGQYHLSCCRMHQDIPVTIEDTKTKVIRPHYIPDWCPLPNKENSDG